MASFYGALPPSSFNPTDAGPNAAAALQIGGAPSDAALSGRRRARSASLGPSTHIPPGGGREEGADGLHIADGPVQGPQSFYARSRRLRNRDLRDLIRSQPSIDGILALAVDRGELWDAISVSTALHAAARRCREGDPRPDFDASSWRYVLELMRLRLEGGEARNAANNVWSLATMSFQNWPIIEGLGDLITRRAQELNIQELSNSCWAFATLRWPSVQGQLYESLVAQVHLKVPFGVNQDLSNTLWALATVAYADQGLFERISGITLTRVNDFKPQELANTIWAMATTALCHDALAVRVGCRAAELAPEFLPQNLANFLWAYAKLGFDEGGVIQRVQDEAGKKLPDFSAQDLSTTLWAFATMAHRSDAFLEPCVATFMRQARCMQESNTGILAQHLSNTLWALATVLLYEPACFHELTYFAREQLPSFKPQELSNTIWACAVVLHKDQVITEAFAQAAASRIVEFDIQGVGNTVWAVSQLEVSSSMELFDRAWNRVLDRKFLEHCTEKFFSMFVAALFKSGRGSQAWDLFEILEESSIDPGIPALGTWWHWCRQRLPEPFRELRVLARIARLRPCRHLAIVVLNAAAARLEELGAFDASCVLLQLVGVPLEVCAEARGEPAKCSVSELLYARLLSKGAKRHGGVTLAEHGGWLRGFVGWRVTGRPRNNMECDYSKECQVLRYVLEHGRRGDPDSVIRCIEHFSFEGSKWLKIAGDEKGAVLDDLLCVLTPRQPHLVVEFGCYVGYSSCRMARVLRQTGGRVISVEVDPIHACIARNMLEFAGVADSVTIYVGHSEDAIPHLHELTGRVPFDAVFMDQRGTRFHIDLETMEEQGLLADDCVILADNVLKPGAPHFLWRLQTSERYDLTVVSLREFASEQIEDWMSVAHRLPGVKTTLPDVPFPEGIGELAFVTDRARSRSCAGRTPGEIGEEEWAWHSQSLRKLYSAVGIRPRIAEVSRDKMTGAPRVLWPSDALRRHQSYALMQLPSENESRSSMS